MTTQLISIVDAAMRLGVSKFTIRRLVDAGELRAVNVGARRLIATSEVERIISNGIGKSREKRTRKPGEPEKVRPSEER